MRIKTKIKNMIREKKYVILICFLLQTTFLFSQESKNNLFLEVRYPKTFGDINKGFAGSNKYIGLIDLGLDYKFFEINNWGVGINLNTSFLKLSETSTHLTILSPKLTMDYALPIDNKVFITQFGIGYANWRLRDSELITGQIGNPSQNEEFKQNENGLAIKVATKLVLNNNKKINWYLQLAYELTKLKNADDLSNGYIFDGNMQVLYPGFGIVWNLKNKEK